MTKTTIHIIRCMAVPFVMLFTTISMGQPSFYPDSLQKELKAAKDDNVRMGYFQELAQGYLGTGFYDSSIIYCDSVILLADRTDDLKTLAGVHITKGNALYYSQGPEAGILSYRESFRCYSAIGDSSGMARVLSGIGVMYKKMAQYDSALACFIEQVTIAERKGYENALGLGYLNIGILYQDWLDFDRASYYLALSIPFNEMYRPDLVGTAHMNIGLIHYGKQQYDSALTELYIARDIYDSLGYMQNIADVYNNFGNVYIAMGNLDSAYHYYSRANRIYAELESLYPLAQTLNNMASVDISRGKINRALTILDSCLSITRTTGNKELEMLAYLNKYEAYNEKREFRNALHNYILYDSLQSMIYDMEKEELMADMEMKYQNEKKQATILALERDNLKKSKQNNIYLFTAIGIIALISFAFLYFRQRAVKDRIIAEQRIRQLEEEKKLLAAKSLVEGQEEERKRIAQELHDGLGVLLSTTRMQFSAIGDTSPEARPLIERASKLLEQAAKDVRKISHNMMPGLLTKLGLFEAVADLFEKLSETDGIHVKTDIPEDAERLPENKEIMIFRIIQEMVNNTLKHAQAQHIEIRMRMMEHRLEIVYSDDGVGFNMEEKLESKSIGLTSLQSRINFLNGKMKVDSAPGKGTAYNIVVPV